MHEFKIPLQGIFNHCIRKQYGRSNQGRPTHRFANRDFTWIIDEPKQMGGSNHAPNPQEYLLPGFGSCMMVAHLVGASVMCIQLAQLEIEVRREIGLGRFLAVNPPTAPTRCHLPAVWRPVARLK